MEVTLEKNDVNCKGRHNGSILVNVSGGTPDYKFVWTDGSKGRKRDSLPAGVYTVEVTDCKGEKQVQSVEIKEPEGDLQLKIEYQDIKCYGAHDAVLKANVTGGTAPYYIVWSDDTEAPEIKNKGTGIYGCIIRDAQRCFVWDSVEITQPATPLTFSPKTEHSQCFGQPKGSLIFDVNGGEKPYKFFINEREAFEKNDSLLSSVYEMKVVDNRGCEITRTAEIRQPDKPLEVSGVVKDVACADGNNGSIVLKVSGGMPGYSYYWTGGMQSKDVNNLTKGVYTVKITDSQKCSVEQTFTVNAPSAPLKLETSVTPVTKKNGSNGEIKVKVSGGTEPYVITCNNKNNFKNLRAGHYNLKLTDKSGCTLIETVIISEPKN